MFLWVVAGVLAVYFLPKPSHYFLFGFTIIVAAYSSKDYFWIAFFLIIYCTPLGLFSESKQDAVYRLPLFQLTSGIGFTTHDIFILLFLGKALLKKRIYQFAFQAPWMLILLYGIFLFFVSIFLRGTSLTILLDHLRFSTYFSLMFSLPILIRNTDELLRIIQLLQPYAIIIFLGGVFFYVSDGAYIFTYFNPYYQIRMMGLGVDAAFSHRFDFHGQQFTLVFLSFFGALVRYSITAKSFDLLISLVCFLVIIFGGFRSWFIIFSFIYLAFFLTSPQKSRLVPYLGWAAVAIFLLVSVSSIGSGLVSSWKRVETVFSIGDESSHSTKSLEFKREYRLGAQLDLIASSPVFGWGFTEKFIDADVGNFGMIAETGIFGFFFFAYLWLFFVLRVIGAIQRPDSDERYHHALKIAIATLGGLLISHFTTNQIFGWKSSMVLVSFFFVAASFLVYRAEGKDEVREKTPQAIGSSRRLVTQPL